MTGERPPSPHLLFAVGTHRCALPLPCVRLVTRPLPVEALATSMSCVCGVALVRGEPLPVVDALALLGVAGEGGVRRFVVVDIGGGRCCVLAVGQVFGVRDLADEPLHEMPPLLRSADGEAVSRLGLLDAQLLLALDAAHLLPAEAAGPDTAGGLP